jgi:hypothetical protein
MPFNRFEGFSCRLIGLKGFHAVSSVWWIFIPFNRFDGFSFYAVSSGGGHCLIDPNIFL